MRNKIEVTLNGEKIQMNLVNTKSLNVTKDKWTELLDGKFGLTITPDDLKVEPSSTYYIGIQTYDNSTKLWTRLPIYPQINNETGDILIEHTEAIDCTIFVTEGLPLPVINPPVPPTPSGKDKIYGVDNVGRSNPIGLLRTDDSVGLTTTLEGNIYSSDFDNAYPWSDISEVTDESGNVFVRIPKFYHKFTENPDGTYKVQISGVKHDETWLTCFVNAGQEIEQMDIGKYEASGSSSLASSKTGQACLVNIALPNMRTACKNNGVGYHQFDIWNYEVIKLLFLVEFATTNSQNIMYGYANSISAAIRTGSCDGIVTGSPVSVTDGKHGCTYRGIENPWGNVLKWADGINFQDANVYVCDDISKYQSDKYDTQYKLVGTGCDNGKYYVKTMSPCKSNYPQLTIPTELYGSTTTHYCDRSYYIGTTGVLCVGGHWNSANDAGLWCWFAGPSTASSVTSGRLCRKV